MQRRQVKIFDFKSADEIELQSSIQISVKYLKSTNQIKIVDLNSFWFKSLAIWYNTGWVHWDSRRVWGTRYGLHAGPDTWDHLECSKESALSFCFWLFELELKGECATGSAGRIINQSADIIATRPPCQPRDRTKDRVIALTAPVSPRLDQELLSCPFIDSTSSGVSAEQLQRQTQCIRF